MNNKIRFPTDEINFVDDVGLANQDHDNYASVGSYPRFDWMRSIIIGLLANQASKDKPIEYRPGTVHFDLNSFFYKCFKDEDFEDISKYIKIINESLYSWAENIEEKRRRFQPTGTFSGVAYDKSEVINIPNNLQNISKSPNRPYLFKNGHIVDPSLIKFNNGCQVAIELSGNAVLNANDSFVVFIKQ